ncbi:MAG: hypothetical protein ACFE8Z_05970 [Candidatus Hermodarchaeota archaeon]
MIRNSFRVWREDGNLTNVSVEDLLDDFIGSLPETSPRPTNGKPEDEFFAEIFKERTVLDNQEKATIPDITCVSCYFSTAVQTLRDELWCSCVNSERHPDAKYFDLRFWVKVESGLPCWRHPLLNSNEEWVQQRRAEILNFLLDPEPLNNEELPVDDRTDNATLAEHYKRAALRTLERCRDEISSEPSFTKVPTREEPPILSEKLTPIKRCQNCYYCVDTKKLRSSWWCACTNPGRSTESLDAGRMWVKSRLGLVCWTKKDADRLEP